jgi:uncharacterized membrane protein
MYFVWFAILGVVIVVAMVLVYNLIIKKRSSKKAKDIFQIITAVLISIVGGGVGFFLAFLVGEGLMEGFSIEIANIVGFGVVSIYNFIVCLFIGRFCPKSIWFAGFLINILVWYVLISNLIGPGGYVEWWYMYAAMVIFAFAGSFVGSILLRKKPKQLDTAQKE